ncbi:hypothetical protein AB0H37_15800 [Actinomadura sp. NPDC023710]|uniref:hypothetical protein n=1 Tax=Actinomadura sp. NPDC023710 TaxID=3158219 RepID=UPI0033C110C8
MERFPMRRSSALLATAALTSSLFLVPGAAHADATGVSLTLDYDKLAKDRVVKLTLGAKSASGVTKVRANMRYQTPEAEPYATVEFTRSSGTDNDGVWQAEFRPDIEARPGVTRVEVLINTADGATYTRNSEFDDCYTTSITDFSNSPGVIDIEHSDVTMRGRVTVQKYREAAPEPASGAKVRTGTSTETTAGEDGSFTLTSGGDASPAASVPREGRFCGTTRAASVTVDRQATVITANMVPGPLVAPQSLVSVYGRIVRRGSTGPVPVAGLEIQLDVPDGLHDAGGVTSTPTSADGTFRAAFFAAREVGRSGAVTVRLGETGFLTGGQAGLGTVSIRNSSEITGFDAFPGPLAYRDPITARGRLDLRPGDTGAANLPVHLEYSLDGHVWKVWATRTLARPGPFSFDDVRPVTKDAYWRVRYPGSDLNMPVISDLRYVEVKYRTQWYDFNASPEPVKKGGSITVKGRLYRFRDAAGPGPNAPVYVYFKAARTTTYKQVAATKTDADGWFAKSFKASVDGTWKAVYKETSGYLGSVSQGDAVDVR